ncbi:hypothetical protein V8F20_001844 [Naviculisporaceae sp. PSN 640]
MFNLKSLVAFGAMAVFSSVSAAPAGALEDRQVQACAYLCGDHFFQGTCLTFCTQHDQCANFGTGFNDWISSIRVPNAPQVSCVFYEHSSCTGASLATDYDETLHDGNGWWADRISSMRCRVNYILPPKA